jgi:hypothetical protein
MTHLIDLFAFGATIILYQFIELICKIINEKVNVHKKS